MSKKRALYAAVLLTLCLALTSYCHAEEDDVNSRNDGALKGLKGMYVAVNFINGVSEKLPDMELKMDKIKVSVNKILRRTGLKVVRKEDINIDEKQLKSQIKGLLKKDDWENSAKNLQENVKNFLQNEAKELPNPNFGLLNFIITVQSATIEGGKKEGYLTYVKASLKHNNQTWYSEKLKPLRFKKRSTIQIKPIVKKLAKHFVKDYKSVN